MNSVTGVIESVGDIETYTGAKGEFSKREVVLSMDGKYPNYVAIELSGDSLDNIEDDAIGRKATVGYFLSGRKGTGKYEGRIFMSLRYAKHEFVSDMKAPAKEEKPVDNNDDENMPF